MKRIILLVTLVLCAAILAPAQTFQAGIFSAGDAAVLVRAHLTGGAITSMPFSNVVVTIFWETSAGLTLGTPSGSYSIGKAGGVGTEGARSYQKFASTPNVNLTLANGDYIDLFTVSISGAGPALMELDNPAGVNGEWYFEVGGEDLTNNGTPFYVSSTELPLPVTLTSFTGKVAQSGTGVSLAWATASEVNNYGYTVQRKAEADAAFADVEGSFVAGHGTTVQPQSYSFTDNTVRVAGKYEYRLKQQDLSGAVQYSQRVIVNIALTDVAEVAPHEFQLLQNYPNPFNPATMVKFSVPATGRATMKVYTMVGQEVATLFNGMAEAGRYYAVSFNAASMASGVYFYRLVTENKTDVRRMMLVR